MSRYKLLNCNHCGKSISSNSKNRHESSCYMNPEKLKLCVVCNSPIKNRASKGTCSYACSNIAFRSGANNGNYKGLGYTSICKQYYDMKCLVCDEKEVIDVHHIDCNRENNSPHNLIPLCPTHHAYMHRGKSHLILEIIKSKMIE